MISYYIPILLTLIVGLSFSFLLLKIAEYIGPKKVYDEKYTTYESGIEPYKTARERFSIKYYLVAIFFIIFDIEVVFFYPWAVTYKKLSSQFGYFIFIEMLVFIFMLLAGYFYIWRKGALEWD
jgi:NADH-quinone oxidoreductase subunit A